MRNQLVLLLLVCTAGCAPRIVDVRPFVVHPTQKLESEDVLTDVQGGVRTTARYQRPNELDEIFRLPGKGIRETGNPFLYKPPKAKEKYTVFHLTLRNESDSDVFIDFNKILLRDWRAAEYRPVDAKKLTDYWVGRVTIELGRPMTWTAQLNALTKKEEKEKLKVETIFSGGVLPARGEHSGYLAFPGVPELIPRERNILFEGAGFLTGAAVGWMGSVQVARLAGFEKNGGLATLRNGLGALVGGLLGRWGGALIAPKRDPQRNYLQLTFDLVTRTSRYGNPQSVSLVELNYMQVRRAPPPPDNEELQEWRDR